MTRLLRSGTFLLLLAFMVGPLAARAQSSGGTSYNLAGGLSLATGSFGDRNDAGYNLAVGFGMTQRGSPIAIRVEGLYNEFNQKFGGGKSRASGLTGNAVYDFSTTGMAFTPYAIGGIGYYSTREPAPFIDVASRTGVGWNIGGGIRVPLSGFSAYVEARYHSVGGADVSFAPIVFGVQF